VPNLGKGEKGLVESKLCTPETVVHTLTSNGGHRKLFRNGRRVGKDGDVIFLSVPGIERARGSEPWNGGVSKKLDGQPFYRAKRGAQQDRRKYLK